MISQYHHLKYPWSRTVCVQAPRIGNKNDCRQCAALIDFNRTPRKRLKIGKENEGVSDSSELGQSTQGRKTCRDTHFAIISIFIALPIICMSGLMTASYRPIHAQHSIFCQKKTPRTQAFTRCGALQFDITACWRYVPRQTAACLGIRPLIR